MLNVLSTLVTAFISPLGTSLMLGILALLIAGMKRRRIALGVSAIAVFWLVFWSLPVANNWLFRLVEGPAVDGLVEDIQPAGAIVILGGGVDPPQLQNARPDLGSAADRVWYGAALFHAGKAPLVVLSGGNPQAGSMSEAEAMLLFLKDLGVPDSVVLMESRSLNTVQNAQFTATILKERGINHILLVTSALHMKRALPHFQAKGLTVTPAPTDYEARTVDGWQAWIPSVVALEGSARAIKEIVGRVIN